MKLYIVVVLLISIILAISPCILSSEISREEEHNGDFRKDRQSIAENEEKRL